MRKAQQLGRYHLFDRIAYGGMAEIFRAKTFDARGHAQWVAIKRVLSHLVEDDEFIQMLVDEAKIASQVRHPNIARVYEFTQARGEYFIAMEHVDGKDLRAILERCRQNKVPLPPHHAAYVAAEIAAALSAVHNAEQHDGTPLHIIHRDVSPSNVICAYSGEVKLCDFGIAKASLSRVKTQTGVIKGKVKYMSPEQALGHKLDHRSDIFSLGACLYEMLTRLPPFTAVNEMDLLFRVRDAVYRPIRAIVPEVPQELAHICDVCLRRRPEERYQTAGELAADLNAFLERYRPGYSRTHLSRHVRRLFADDIEAELRELEAYVVSRNVDDDVGENLIAPSLGPNPEYEDFSPYPSDSTPELLSGDESAVLSADTDIDMAGEDTQDLEDLDDLEDTNVGDIPEDAFHPGEFDIHQADTLIIEGRPASLEPEPLAAEGHRAGPADRQRSELHGANTMILHPYVAGPDKGGSSGGGGER